MDELTQRLPLAASGRDIIGGAAPVLVFCHATSGRLNVVYRRRNGYIGWVIAGAPDRANGLLFAVLAVALVFVGKRLSAVSATMRRP